MAPGPGDRQVGADRAVRDELHRPVRRRAATRPGRRARTGAASPAGWTSAARAGRTRSPTWPPAPCAVYRSAVTKALPGAVIVVDHFHLARLANQAVTRVRQRVTRQVLGRRGTSKDPAWANRRRLLRGRERLSDQAYSRMWEEILAQEATDELLATWVAKEELRYLLALARSHPARSEISNRLFAFYDWCARADVPEVTTLAKTIEAWSPQILALIDTGITNAATEANNRLIKDAARIAFGFRNLDNQRRRVRLHCKRTTIS
jgi:transposase